MEHIWFCVHGKLWCKELMALGVWELGTRMRWSGGECGCGSRGKKVGELFHDCKSCFCLLRKPLSDVGREGALAFC